MSTKNKHETNQSSKYFLNRKSKQTSSTFYLWDSEELNSDPENELMNSEEFNQTDFQKDIDFGMRERERKKMKWMLIEWWN